MKWYASEDSWCTTTDWEIGSRSHTVGTNTPYVVGPAVPAGSPAGAAGYNFSAVPPGDYFLCAIVDPTNVNAETLEWDNKIVSWFADLEVRP